MFAGFPNPVGMAWTWVIACGGASVIGDLRSGWSSGSIALRARTRCGSGSNVKSV
jgi:hypothetical protein